MASHPSAPEERSTNESMRLLMGHAEIAEAVCTARWTINVLAKRTVLWERGYATSAARSI